MLKIGITGGIGSGKSTVAKIFSIFGIPIYNADETAKKIMNEQIEIINLIKKEFGNNAYLNNELNKNYIAKIVFNKPDKLQKLNSIVHPVIISDAENWMNKQMAPYCIKEAAIIFESGSQQNLDYVIGVYAPINIRIQRTMNRDKITKEEVLARINKQLDENIKMKLCDFIITNDDNQMVIPQVLSLHNQILKLVKK